MKPRNVSSEKNLSTVWEKDVEGSQESRKKPKNRKKLGKSESSFLTIFCNYLPLLIAIMKIDIFFADNLFHL